MLDHGQWGYLRPSRRFGCASSHQEGARCYVSIESDQWVEDAACGTAMDPGRP